MASAIDDTKPVTGTPTTQSVRDNFAAAKSEITALQATVPTWTVGSVPFATSTTALGQDNANLYFDNANDRLGIGTAAPLAKLQVKVATDQNLRVDYYSSLLSLHGLNDAGSAWVPININSSGSVYLCKDAGNVGIGTPSPGYRLHLLNASTAGTIAAVVSNGPAGADTTSMMFAFNDYGQSNLCGAITRNGTNTVAYATTSDERLKDAITDSNRGLDALLAIKVSDYKMGETSQQGLLAQQVAEHYPEAVHEGGEDANLEPWMIDYGRLTPLLIKAVQDLAAQVDDLKAQLASAKPA